MNAGEGVALSDLEAGGGAESSSKNMVNGAELVVPTASKIPPSST